MADLVSIDRIPKAIRLYRILEKRDPLHAGLKANLAGLLLLGGDAEAAILKAQEALELKPQHFLRLWLWSMRIRLLKIALPH